MKKSPATIGIITTLVIGIVFLFVIIISQRDDIKNGSDVAILASDLGMNKDQFLADMESDAVKKIVEDQKTDALNRLDGRASTPSIFINGEIFVRQTNTDLEEKLASLVNEAKVGATNLTLPIKVEVFEDYNCSACAQFQYQLHEIEVKFTTAEVDLQKKNLPFLKETSEKYARAAEAARIQGKFSQYDLELYMLAQGIDYDFYDRATYQAPVSY